MTECAICFDSITAETGKTVLACGHEYHMLCIVRWFQGQEGPSSCPYCRHEAGELDNVPMAEDSEGEGEEDDDNTDDGSGDGEAEDLEAVWFRAPDGTWIRHWRETVAPEQWKPTEAADEPPDGLTQTATQIQSTWRGHTIRADMAAAGMLLSLSLSLPLPLQA